MTFTAKQISDWHRYEKVRQSGRWNMFDPRARRATGMSQERYTFVMRNFVALLEAAEATKSK